MKPLAVHHVSINVTDVDDSIRFYTDVLGLSLRSDRPDFGFPGAWLDAGDQQLHLIPGPRPDARGPHFALRVDDLDAVTEELRTRGIRVSDPSAVGASRQAFLEDPSGNQIELHQVG